MLSKPWKEIDGCKIFGNSIPRATIGGWELSEEEKKEFDYYTEEELLQTSFFRYKDNVYDLGEFMRLEGLSNDFRKIADGIHSDTFFSGILVKFCDDNDYIKVYTFYS